MTEIGRIAETMTQPLRAGLELSPILILYQQQDNLLVLLIGQIFQLQQHIMVVEYIIVKLLTSTFQHIGGMR